MNTVLGMLDHWMSQDVARTNAAQACVRLMHDRRERHDVETWLAEHPAAVARTRRLEPKTPGSARGVDPGGR
jgi:hypothetical protein